MQVIENPCTLIGMENTHSGEVDGVTLKVLPHVRTSMAWFKLCVLAVRCPLKVSFSWPMSGIIFWKLDSTSPSLSHTAYTYMYVFYVWYIAYHSPHLQSRSTWQFHWFQCVEWCLLIGRKLNVIIDTICNTVWREIFVGQHFRGFRRFASDRENFNCEILWSSCFVLCDRRTANNFFAKSLPAANPRKFCPAKISRHTVVISLPGGWLFYTLTPICKTTPQGGI